MLSLYDIGCRWPECNCKVPHFAFSEHNRRQYCLRALSPNKGKIMENDEMATVELVSSEISGYLNSDGQFTHGTPPAEKPFNGDGTRYVQTDEDAIEG